MSLPSPTLSPLHGVFAEGGWIEPLDESLVARGVEAGLFGDAPPVLLGRYRLSSRIGSGGGGVVYRGFDPHLRRPVAIKLFRAQGGDTEVARLRHEGQAIANLHGPHIVAVYDVLEVGRGVAVVMEWIDGTPLDVWLGEERTADAILAAFLAAGQALAAIHRAGWVHRDFKPANVMMTRNDEPRLVDFGLAAPRASSASWRGTTEQDSTDRLTRDGAYPGTPAYMAPEARAGTSPDAARDQYAFCVSLFEALYGHLPPRDLSEVQTRRRAGVSGAVRQALARGLSPDPTQRYPTMAALLAALVGRSRARRVGLGIALGAATIAAAVWAAPQGESCRDGLPQLDPPWVDVRDRIAARGPDTLDRDLAELDASLTDYEAQWRAVADQACEDPELAQARIRCLEDRRDAHASFVKMLETAEPLAMHAAVTGVERLPSAQRCAEPGDSEFDGWMPPNAVAVALRRRLHDADALQYAARHDEALEALEKIVAEAEASHLVPIEVQARAHLGESLVHSGRIDEGIEVHTAAYTLAREQGFDAEAARLASGLAFSVGYMRGDYEAGVTWGRHAQALLDRLGLEGEAQARLDGHLGSVEALAGHYDRAEAHHRAAAAINERNLETGSGGRLASSLNNLGNLMILRSRWDEAMELHTRALELRQEWLGPAHPHVAVSKCSIAAIHMGRSDWEAAREELEDALQTWEASVGPSHRDLVHPLNNLATVARKQDRLTEAEAWVERSLHIAEAHYGDDDPRLATTHQIHGQVLEAQGRTDEALDALFKAQRSILAALGPEHDDLAQVNFAIARLYFDLERWDEALHYSDLVVDHWLGVGRSHADRDAADRNAGVCLLELDRPDEAHERLSKLLARVDRGATDKRAEVQHLLDLAAAPR